MIRCSNCGCENLDNSVYCMHCSRKLLQRENEDNINQLSDIYYSYLNTNYNTHQSGYCNDNHTSSVNDNQGEQYFIKSNEKNLFIAMLLSMLVPGFGLVYLKRVLLGVFIFLMTLLLWIMTGIFYYLLRVDIVSVMLSLSIMIYFASIIYTYIVVTAQNGESKL